MVEELLGATVLEGLFEEYHFSSAALGRHLSVIGQHHPYSADVKMSLVRIIQRKVNGRGENNNRKCFATVMADSPLPPTPLQGHTAWGILSGKAFPITTHT